MVERASQKVIERVGRMPARTKLAVVLLVVLVATAVNYFAVGVPTFGPPVSELEQRIERVRREQRKLDLDHLEKQAIANNLSQFRRDKEVLEQRLRDALSELPDDKRIDELLQLLQDRATKAGLEILTIEPQQQVAENFYARIPIPMSVQGGYHEIAAFLDAVARLQRIVNVNNLSFDQPKDAAGRMVLTARFLATTFMFVEAKAAAKPAPEGARR